MTAWLAETLVATGVLIALVLLIRKPVARIFGARAAYALWAAPLLKLLVPSLPEPVADSTVVIVYDPGAVANAAPATSALPDIGQALLWLWLAGAALFLLYQYAAHRRFISRALRQGRTLERGPGPMVIESGGVDGPVAVGVLRQRIILPTGFGSRVTPEQRELAMAHERLHHQRLDLPALAGATVMLAIHWFNPLAYAAYRAFRADQEAACDAQLAQSLSRNQRAAYAEALVRCAAAPVPQAICTLTTVEDLKGRLKMLKLNHGRSARVSGAAIAVILAGAGVAVTAQAAPQARTVFAVPVAPTPPSPPAPPAAPVPLTLIPVAPAPSPASTAVVSGLQAPAAPLPPTRPASPATPQVKSFVITGGAARPADANNRIISSHLFVVKDGEVVHQSGTPATRVEVRSCNGRQFQASGGSNANNTSQQSSFFICTDGSKSNSEFANVLEQSLRGIEGNAEMSAQTKSTIGAQLRAKIAELRAR